MPKTAILVIDLQNDFTAPWGSVYREKTGKMMPHIGEVLDKAREKGVLIVIVWSGSDPNKRRVNKELSRMNDSEGKPYCLILGTPGCEYDEHIHYDPKRDIKMKKFGPSAFFKTQLEEVLRAKGVENVLTCGVKTQVCVRATTVDAASCGFRTFALRDMTGSNDGDIDDILMEDISKYFAKAITSDEMFEMIEKGEL